MVDAANEVPGAVPPAEAQSTMSKMGEAIKNSKTAESIDRLKASGEHIANAGAALGNHIKDKVMGGANRTGGTVGGIAGGTAKFTDGVVAKTIGLVASFATKASNFAQKHKGVALAGIVVGAYAVVKGFLSRRDKKAEITELSKRNELAATQLSNSSMQGGMPEFDNQTARGGFAQNYATRNQQQSSGRGA